MENFKIYIFLSVFLFSFNEIVNGYSCDYAECTCMEDMITCVGVAAPRFKYRATVTMLYMDNVQVVNLIDILKNLPNLKYLSLVNMKYFNCKWMKEVPRDVYVRTNMCLKLTSTPHYPTTGQFFFEEKTLNQDKVSEQEDKMLSSRYGTRYPSVTELPEREDTKQISEQIDKRQSTSMYNEGFETKTTRYSEYPQSQNLKDGNNRYFWWILLAISCIVVTIIIPSIVHLCRKKLLRRIQPQDIEDDIAIPLSEVLNEDNPLRDDDE